jgi:hypothetical protein
VQFNFDAIRKMPAWLVDQYVPTGYQKEAFPTFKEKAAGIGQLFPLFKRTDTCGAEEEGFDHR